MNLRTSLEEIENFAGGVGPESKGVWFAPYAMAQTMLSLAAGIRERDDDLLNYLRAWDSITLAISILIRDSEGMSKKQIRARLEEIYAEDYWPNRGQS